MFAEAHYNMGRDMDIVLWLSGLTLIASLILIVVLGIILFVVIRKRNPNDSIETRKLRN